MKIRNKAKARNAAIVLVAILGVFIFLGKDSLKPDDNNQGRFRFPASHLFGELRSASIAVEKKYAAQLAAPSLKTREMASIGRPANPLENFRFGVLEGKYAVTMDGDVIRDVAFIDTPESQGSPTSVGNRTEFLNKYAPLFGVKGVPEKVSIDVKGNQIIETYKMQSKEGMVAIVSVVLDDSDRLIKLHSEKTDRKIF